MQAEYERQEVMHMALCPLMSSATNKVGCTEKCALCLREGQNFACSITTNALHTLEIEKKVELLTRNIKH